MAVPAAQDALAAEADALERPLRADVLDVRVGADPVQPEDLEAEVAHERLGLAVGPRPPPPPAEPRADDRAAVAPRELRQAGDADDAVLVVVLGEVELLALRALARQPVEVGLRLRLHGVRPPGEPARDLRVRAQLERRGASSGPAGSAGTGWGRAGRGRRRSGDSTNGRRAGP